MTVTVLRNALYVMAGWKWEVEEIPFANRYSPFVFQNKRTKHHCKDKNTMTNIHLQYFDVGTDNEVRST